MVSATELEHALDGVVRSVATTAERALSPALRMPGSEWSINQAAAHLAISQELFAGLVTGETHPYGDRSQEAFAAVNARLLADATGTPAAVSVARMRAATETLL